MPTLGIRIAGETHSTPYEPGRSVREILDTTPFRVRSACHGSGACGLCRVRVISGDAGPITPNERIHLHENLLEHGERLACQLHPSEDLTFEILNPAPPSNWRATPEGFWRRGESREHDFAAKWAGVRHPCGIAVDVGTTHISVSLLDLERGRSLADRWGPNPQSIHGADVISRLAAAAGDPGISHQIANLVLNALAEALQDLAGRHGFDLRRIVCATLVGNTAMLTLLTGKNHALLLRPENWTRPIDCTPDDVAPWVARWGIHSEAEVDLVQPLAGFVGSDLLAGLIAVRLTEGVAPALFVDFGTNSEAALWDGRKLWVTSAAGGPAFESGTGIGMPAEPGAVYRVTRNGGTLTFHLLDEAPTRGICGSGIVDLIARLREEERLSERGNVAGGVFRFSAGGREMSLTKRDVDAFQRAKAGVSAAIAAICEEAGVAIHSLKRFCIAGAFGRYLDVESAQAVGLVPVILPERIELSGNTALSGCADLLLSSVAGERLSQLRNREPRIINLANFPGFEAKFVEHLYLRPFTGA